MFKSSKENNNAKSLVKTILIAFFDDKVIIHHEFVPEKQIVKVYFYKEMIKRLLAQVPRIRPEFQESESWYLLHDNAPEHSSGVVSEFLAK
jgi:hypothetical protein